ncbi:kinase-like domain-containing protein [Aspergillus aurantiobrunneus]
MSAQYDDTSLLSHDPYIDLPEIGPGMTGSIFELGKNRVVKKAKQYQTGHFRDPEVTEYMSEINQKTLKNENQVLQRLGSHQGIIPCFHISQYGIELALAQADLADYLETYPEPGDAFKSKWILRLIEAFSYVHSRKVFVDDITLRNILVLDGQLKLADFGQSILLPLDADVASINKNHLTVQIEILHIGWILYSIASWKLHIYYFFGRENPNNCWPESFPNADDVLCGKIIRKCWHGEYASMDHVQDEAHQLFAGH